MIEITADIPNHFLRITGHAGGTYGTDIVCAAVSALAMTLAQMCADLRKQDPNVYPEPEIVMESGMFQIHAACHVKNAGILDSMSAIIRLDTVFQTVYCGLFNLAETYPKKIRCMG